MKRELKIILLKFMIITSLVILYVFVAVFAIAPYVTHIAFGQQFPQDQFNNNQFQQGQQGFNQGFDQNQFGNNQFGQQGFNQGFQQPYQQYGTPTYMPQQYGPYNQQYGNTGTVLEQIITAIAAAGGSMAYTRRKTNQLEDTNQQLYSEVLKGKQVDAELARITYAMNQEKANQINDAPAIKLQTLQDDVQQFTDKTAKA